MDATKLRGTNVRFDISIAQSRHSALVKSFGRRQASESRRGTNPRAGCGALWVFEDFVGARVRVFVGATLFGMT
jgi:hypothetical protein